MSRPEEAAEAVGAATAKVAAVTAAAWRHPCAIFARLGVGAAAFLAAYAAVRVLPRPPPRAAPPARAAPPPARAPGAQWAAAPRAEAGEL